MTVSLQVDQEICKVFSGRFGSQQSPGLSGRRHETHVGKSC